MSNSGRLAADEHAGSISAAYPVWQAAKETRIVLPEICVMHGGPIGMRLPEHEHSEIQVSIQFTAQERARCAKSQTAMPSVFSLIPSGKPHVGFWRDGTEVIVALLSREGICRAADELLSRSLSEIQSATCAVDPVILSIGSSLRGEFLSQRPVDSLFIEAIGVFLTGHLVRRWNCQPGVSRLKGLLSQNDLRKTIVSVEAGLATGIRISSLAADLGMGVHQFTRRFRRTVGCSPYRFVMQQRIERARKLLEKTNLPLADLALEVGFVSQSHFTSAFRKYLHATPHSYRFAFRNAS